jgi:hypothetical protein
MKISYLEYDGDNMKFLNALKERAVIDETILFRSSDIKHLLRMLEYGTDRAGFSSDKMWGEGIPYEETIIATDINDILKGEEDKSYSNSFKKFDITENPTLVLYDKSYFKKLAHKEFQFINPHTKLDSIKEIFVVKKVNV